MRLMNRKIPAFTIMEVTISMLVAAIAIVIAFTAFRIVSGSYTGFTKKQEKVAMLTVLDKLLKKDFLSANRIVKLDEGLALQLEEGIVTYTFKENYFVRDQFSLRKDTFKLQVSEPVFLFEANVAESGKPIDQLNFMTRIDGDPVPLHYHKLYSAQNLFQ